MVLVAKSAWVRWLQDWRGSTCVVLAVGMGGAGFACRGWCWVCFFFFFLFLVVVGLMSVDVVGFVIDDGGGGDWWWWF